MNKWFLILIAFSLLGQTRVDLKNQAKSVDFGAANRTRPFQTGSALPPVCSVGDMYFKTDSTTGQNLYGCVATNQWSAQGSTGGAGGSASNMTVTSGGALVGSRSAIDFVPGSGILTTIADTGTSVRIQHNINTAVMETVAGHQSGTSTYCVSDSNSSTDFACQLSPTLTAYSPGIVLLWKPDWDGAGGATTLNVDGLGAVPIRLSDGIGSPSPGDIIGGTILALGYDGVSFRILQKTAPDGLTAAQRPACGITMRGRSWYIPGVANVSDDMSVCTRDSTGNYAWRRIY